MPAAAVIRKVRALSGFIGFKGSAGRLRERRPPLKRAVKSSGSTAVVRRELGGLSAREAGGIRGVAVKCIDITKNPDCEGSLP